MADNEPSRKATLASLRAALALAFLLSAGARAEPAELGRYEFNRSEMGVPFRIVLYAPTEAQANLAASAAFARVSQLNDLLSDYDYDSELSRLSHTSGSGQAVHVSEDLWRVLTRAQEVAQVSAGAFDITVGPCVNLWRRARRELKLPDPQRLQEALKAVGYWRVRLDPKRHTATLSTPNMRLDLGGIAKGYAVEETLKVLRTEGITRALVGGGGDLIAGDPPPGRAGWRIEVAPLDVTNAPPPCYVSLHHAALSTSGDLFQHLEIDGRRYSHVIDPRTGIGLLDHNLVTTIAPDGMTADALGKVVGVLGYTASAKLIDRMPGVGVHVVRKPGARIEVYQNRRFGSYLESPRSQTH